MEIADKYRKDREAREKRTTPPPQGHTLAEILHDKNKDHLFFKLLNQLGDQDLAQRLIEGKLEETDIHLLEEKRLIFSEKITQSEKIEKMLTKENIIYFTRNRPEFEEMININGPEKAIRAIKSQLRETAMTDENRFNEIASSIEVCNDYKEGKYKKIYDEVEELCKNGKFTPQEYLDALAIEDPEEKKKALRKLSRQQYGGFRRAIHHWSSGLGKDTLKDLNNSEISLEESFNQLNIHYGNIGSALFSSVSGNEQMRNAFFAELVNEKAPEEPKIGFKDAKKEASDAFNEDEYNQKWEDYKIRAKYTKKNASEQDIIKSMFVGDQKNAYKETVKGMGFWASIFAAIFEGKINSKKATLK